MPTESLAAYKSATTWKEFFNISGISTAIDGIEAEETAGKEKVYDLLGRQRNAQTKGLVIKNGKKVIKN